MNTGFRRLLQRGIEFPNFKSMGLGQDPGDLLEIGCGSGYGATLLLTLQLQSYLGVDLMPEQIALAQQRRLAKAVFTTGDATNLSGIGAGSKDTVVIFGVLHHIPEWRKVIEESHRELRPGGKLFLEEPGGEFLNMWEPLFHWGHLGEGMFRLRELEACLHACGFTILRRRYLFGFGVFVAQK